jgi:uncharacterized protein
MFQETKMQVTVLSAVIGFVALFIEYHLPEFFDAFWIAAVGKIGFIILAYLIARIHGFTGLAGFGLGRKNLFHLFPGWVLGITTYLSVLFISMKFNFIEISLEGTFQGFWKNLPTIMIMTAVPSIAEDILTRGYLFAHLDNRVSKRSFVALSAILFYLNHIWRITESIDTAFYLLCMGLTLAYAVIFSGSLWLAFGIHWGSNLTYELTRTMIPMQEFNPAAVHYIFGLLLLTVMFVLILFKKKQHAVIVQ